MLHTVTKKQARFSALCILPDHRAESGAVQRCISSSALTMPLDERRQRQRGTSSRSFAEFQLQPQSSSSRGAGAAFAGRAPKMLCGRERYKRSHDRTTHAPRAFSNFDSLQKSVY